MKRPLLLIFFIFSFVGYSQNWSVFNKNYRYNYKFDNSSVVTNVIFAELYGANATQTTCVTNTIGVVTGTFLTLDQPQFLNKNIITMANGNVILQNPDNITIIPTCSLWQTWIFDPNGNITATCVSTSTRSIFSTVDSIKTIVVSMGDSVVLSKQFGIIQFPKLYAQNKYYKLVGIENKTTYDLTALFGEKVPNAWDFYDYSIGHASCGVKEWTYASPQSMYCAKVCDIVKTKTVSSNAYMYNVDRGSMSNAYPVLSGYCSSPNATVAFSNINVTIDGSPFAGPLGLGSPSLTENNYYPGYVPDVSVNRAAIVKLGKDNTGRLYKYVGPGCNASGGLYVNPSQLGIVMPNQNEPMQYSCSCPTTACNTNNVTWGVGLGKVSELGGMCVSGYSKYCITSLGTVGLPNPDKEELTGLVYPNPAHTLINLAIDRGIARLFDLFGRVVKEMSLEGKNTIDISGLSNGLYLIEIQTDSFKSTQRLIIQH
jgi:hypothetical protein